MLTPEQRAELRSCDRETLLAKLFHTGAEQGVSLTVGQPLLRNLPESDLTGCLPIVRP